MLQKSRRFGKLLIVHCVNPLYIVIKRPVVFMECCKIAVLVFKENKNTLKNEQNIGYKLIQ